MLVSEPTPTNRLAATADPVLELRGVSKRFGAVLALKGVDLTVMPGEVHAVVGENGAGKSTLISIAGGILPASDGKILVDGVEVRPSSSDDMRSRGIAVASQHPSLAPDLTVEENIRLVARQTDASGIVRLLARVADEDMRIDPAARVETLNLAERHVVEIARALAVSPRILVLDEPTEPFQEAGVRKLFGLMSALKADGVGIVYISHRLNEVMEVADRISVIRDGSLVDTGPAGQFGLQDIVTRIAGRPLAEVFPPKRAVGSTGTPALEVRGLSGHGFAGVDLTVAMGEIVGLTGIEGQGQRSLLRALAGTEPVTGGTLVLAGKSLAVSTPSAARGAGIGFVCNDRHAEGLFLPLSIRENISLGIAALVSRAGIVSPGRERTEAGTLSRTFGVKAPNVESEIAVLSGGNQQKVLIAREMAAGPKVLLIDEPTHGVDIGARSEIYHHIRNAADDGMAVIVNASDGIELEGLSDRVLVFSRGAVVKELIGDDVNDTAITEANLGATGLWKKDEEKKSRMGWLSDDYMPAVLLALVSLGLIFATSGINPRFLSAFNLSILMTFVSALSMVAAAQLCLMLLGEIDLSVGPLAGLVVVLSSFLLADGQTGGETLIGVVGILAFCAVFGLVQGLIAEGLRLPLVVITLATFSGIQGVSLLLRPQPAGMITETLSDIAGYSVAGVPASMLAALAIVVGLEFVLRRTHFGRLLRASGSAPLAVVRQGLPIRRVRLAVFALCGLLTGIGGLVLAGQVGIGTATTGVNYTLLSITAVVISGARIAGGRGSFVAVLAAAVMVQTITLATPFLQISDAWQYWLVGGSTLLAAALFRLASGRNGAADTHH